MPLRTGRHFTICPNGKRCSRRRTEHIPFFVVLSEHMVAAVYQKSKDGRPMKQALALVKYNPARWNKKTKDHGLWEVEFPTDQHFAGYAWMAKLLELRDAVEQWNIAIAMKKKKQREKEEAERLEVING